MVADCRRSTPDNFSSHVSSFSGVPVKFATTVVGVTTPSTAVPLAGAEGVTVNVPPAIFVIVIVTVLPAVLSKDAV